MAEPFITPIPEAFKKDSGTAEWARQLTLWLDDISRPGGVLAASEATGITVVTQGATIDTLATDLDTVSTQTNANTAAIAVVRSGLPTYVISNDGTVRTFNADAALITAGVAYSQTEQQQLIDAVGVLSDVLATLIRDLKNKGILGV